MPVQGGEVALDAIGFLCLGGRPNRRALGFQAVVLARITSRAGGMPAEDTPRARAGARRATMRAEHDVHC
jgi:hypothetical protein